MLVENLKARALYLKKARSFFDQRGVLEVDCPSAIPFANLDAHIDPLLLDQNPPRFLFTSPEYGMKRLLAAGCPDIYQLSHVFRKEEKSPLHNPEFTLVEWYRIKKDLNFLINETVAFIRLFLGNLPSTCYSYRELLKKHAGLDYVSCRKEDILKTMNSRGIYPTGEFHKEELIQQAFSLFVEPKLGVEELSVVENYPEDQAALSILIETDGIKTAQRFEIYFQGIELANGYQELSDPIEQKRRFESENEKRAILGKEPWKIDPRFLSALAELPPCCGVAAGFDRLLMLSLNEKELSRVLPFSWETA